MPTGVLESAMWVVMWARRVAAFVVVVIEEDLGGEVGPVGPMTRRE